jgi:hypothetical protein
MWAKVLLRRERRGQTLWGCILRLRRRYLDSVSHHGVRGIYAAAHGRFYES